MGGQVVTMTKHQFEAALDGRRYTIKHHPDIPLHPNCRCVLVPITRSKEAFGLTQAMIDESARPYSIHEDKVIGLGGRRTRDSGVFVGGFDKWWHSQSPKVQKEIVGKIRMELINSGKIKFRDIADANTGRLKTL